MKIAQIILNDRGLDVTEQQISSLYEQRLVELSKPEGTRFIWVFLGYIFALTGGLIGIFIGWHLAFHKKKLPNGTQVLNYTKTTRKDGKIILFIAIPCTIFWFIYYRFYLII